MATAKKQSKASKVRAYQAAHPKATAVDVAKACGITPAYVYAIRHSDKKPNVKTPKKVFKWTHVTTATSNEPAMPFKEEAERIYELTKGRQRMHPVTGKMLMQATPTKEEPITMEEPTPDNVNHPAHYKVGGIETIDFIEAKGLNYHLGNVVKYITRADTKGNREEDLLKARWYLNREIAKFAK
jgi:hypothetical protein